MSKFGNFKIKWPKSEEKIENAGRLGPFGQNSPPPPNRSAESASELICAVLAARHQNAVQWRVPISNGSRINKW